MTREESDEFYHEHGSTIEGLRLKLQTDGETGENIASVLRDFYQQVWSDMDYSSLLSSKRNGGDTTGYSHIAKRSALQDLLSSIRCPIYFASNSPSWHVKAVLEALGLSAFSNAVILAPDTVKAYKEELDFPTKAHPLVFFRSLIKKYESKRLILVDDSKLNLKKAFEIGIEGVHVENNLEEAIAIAIGHVEKDYKFSDIEYLKAKNEVDAKSIDHSTWKHLTTNVEVGDDGILRIADLGAGILLTLEIVLEGREDKKALVDFLPGLKGLEYHAYESNQALYEGCVQTLSRLGFQKESQKESTEGITHFFINLVSNHTVHLHLYDYEKESPQEYDRPIHLIIGCCFADLIEPFTLVKNLKYFLGEQGERNTLVYFPITFTGTTQFFPPKPFSKSIRGWIPSDTIAFRAYSEALEVDMGHNLDPNTLIHALNTYGCELLHRGASNWVIEKGKNPYFWRTMMYFFGTVGAPKMLKQSWDSLGWINQSKNCPNCIIVSNTDLLFRFITKPLKNTDPEHSLQQKDAEEIQFTAPFEVSTIIKPIHLETDVGPEQVLIESTSSLISSGTELKIYRGQFDDASLDTNIEGMTDERMAYPLAYGYSLVGKVVRIGTNVDPRILGKTVFTFSPHSTHVITSKDALQMVPDGISADDAIFFPSVETALSLVHDAGLLVGEKVAVYGQGLIGLLVTSILSMQKTPLDGQNGNFGTITTFDTLVDRLAMSASMGASQALLPQESDNAGPFDVSIEISGNSKALQSAIDNTRDGGRIIVGSWYGSADVKLKLGIDFHRSHKTIQTSQVSDIPAKLTTLWSKERRFELTWELVKLLKPSRLISKTTSLSRAKEAYDSLNEGKEIAV
eukprot:CAMPEP_0194214746 /NCGR_PEP_ID=MMETSP0156-20130528/16098_1 /TAXON_ID=33649 /ORGANISM="Thalassionema nitzschioides, Strain L26-B" /LENGTH=852 /DNA_ID=CAMNT_0038943079 /DNA_START=226 /DNA_END=2781 /DNA_ORIENTATION=-